MRWRILSAATRQSPEKAADSHIRGPQCGGWIEEASRGRLRTDEPDSDHRAQIVHSLIEQQVRPEEEQVRT